MSDGDRKRVFEYGHCNEFQEVTKRGTGRGAGRARGSLGRYVHGRNPDNPNSNRTQNDREGRDCREGQRNDPVPAQLETYHADPRLARRNGQRGAEGTRLPFDTRNVNTGTESPRSGDPFLRLPSSERGGLSRAIEDFSKVRAAEREALSKIQEASRARATGREGLSRVENPSRVPPAEGKSFQRKENFSKVTATGREGLLLKKTRHVVEIPKCTTVVQQSIGNRNDPKGLSQHRDSRFTVPVPLGPLPLDLEVGDDGNETHSPGSHLSNITVEVAPTSSSGSSHASNANHQGDVNLLAVEKSAGSNPPLITSKAVNKDDHRLEKKRKLSKELEHNLFRNPPSPADSSSSKKSSVSRDSKRSGCSRPGTVSKRKTVEMSRLTDITLFEKSDAEKLRSNQDLAKKPTLIPSKISKRTVHVKSRGVKPSSLKNESRSNIEPTYPKSSENTDAISVVSESSSAKSNTHSSLSLLEILTKANTSTGAEKDNVVGILKKGFYKWKNSNQNPASLTFKEENEVNPLNTIVSSDINSTQTGVINSSVETGVEKVEILDDHKSPSLNSKNCDASASQLETRKRKASGAFPEFTARRKRIDTKELGATIENVDDGGNGNLGASPRSDKRAVVEIDEESSFSQMVICVNAENNINNNAKAPFEKQNSSNESPVESSVVKPFLFEDILNDDQDRLESSNYQLQAHKPSAIDDISLKRVKSSVIDIIPVANDRILETSSNLVTKVVASSHNSLTGRTDEKTENRVKSTIPVLRGHSSAEDISDGELEEVEFSSLLPQMIQMNDQFHAGLSPVSSGGMPHSDDELRRTEKTSYNPVKSARKIIKLSCTSVADGIQSIAYPEKISHGLKAKSKGQTEPGHTVVVSPKKRTSNHRPLKMSKSKETAKKDIAIFVEKRRAADLNRNLEEVGSVKHSVEESTVRSTEKNLKTVETDNVNASILNGSHESASIDKNTNTNTHKICQSAVVVVEMDSTTSDEAAIESAPLNNPSDSTPPDYTIQSAPLDNPSDSMPPDYTIPSAPLDNSRESAPQDYPNESAPPDYQSELTPLDNSRESAPLDNSSESAPLDYQSESALRDHPIESAPLHNSSESTPQDYPNEFARVDNLSESVTTDYPSESAPQDYPNESAPLDNSSESVLDHPIESAPLDNTSEPVPPDYPSVSALRDHPIESAPLDNTSEPVPQDYPSVSALRDHPIESASLDNPNESVPDHPIESAPLDNTSESVPQDYPNESAHLDNSSQSAPPDYPSESALRDYPIESAPRDNPSEYAPLDNSSESAPRDYLSESFSSGNPSESAPPVYPSESTPSDNPSESLTPADRSGFAVSCETEPTITEIVVCKSEVHQDETSFSLSVAPSLSLLVEEEALPDETSEIHEVDVLRMEDAGPLPAGDLFQLNEETGYFVAVEPPEESELQTEDSNNEMESESVPALNDANSVSVLVSGLGLDASALAGRNDLVIINMDSFFSSSEDSEEGKTPSPEMPQLLLTEEDFPVMSIPERDDNSMEADPLVVSSNTSDIAPLISADHSEHANLINLLALDTASRKGADAKISSDHNSESIKEKTKVSTKRLSLGQEIAGSSNEVESLDSEEDELDRPMVRIRSDLFSDSDVDAKTEELLEMINEKGKTVQSAVCSCLLKFSNTFQTGTAKSKLQAFRSLKDVFSKSYYIMDRFDVQLTTEEVLKYDLPASNQYDMYKHITVEEMAEYFVRLYQLTIMLRKPEFFNHRSNLFILHYRMSRILKYYAVSKIPSHTEGNFMNIVKATESKISNFAANRHEIIRVWDYIKSFSFPVDEHIVLQEHATVGVKGFGTLIEAILQKHRQKPQQQPAATATSTATESSANEDIEILGEFHGSKKASGSSHTISVESQLMPGQVMQSTSAAAYTVTRTSPISPVVLNAQSAVGRQTSIGINSMHRPPPYGDAGYSIQSLNPTSQQSRLSTGGRSQNQPSMSSCVPQPTVQHPQSLRCIQGTCPYCPRLPTFQNLTASHVNPNLLVTNQLTQELEPARSTKSRRGRPARGSQHTSQNQQNTIPNASAMQPVSTTRFLQNSHSQHLAPNQQQATIRLAASTHQQQQQMIHHHPHLQNQLNFQAQMSQHQRSSIPQNRVQNPANSQSFPVPLVPHYNAAIGSSQYNVHQPDTAAQSYSVNNEYVTISPAASPNNITMAGEPGCHYRTYSGSTNVTVNTCVNQNERVQIRRVYSVNPNMQQSNIVQRQLQDQQQMQQHQIQTLAQQIPSIQSNLNPQIQSRNVVRSVSTETQYAVGCNASMIELLQSSPSTLQRFEVHPNNSLTSQHPQQNPGVIYQQQPPGRQQLASGTQQVVASQQQQPSAAIRFEPADTQVVQNCQIPCQDQYSHPAMFPGSVSTTIHHIPRETVRYSDLPLSENTSFPSSVNMNMILPQ